MDGIGVELEGIAPVYGGLCLCRHDGVVFLKGAIPGEIVRADVKERRRDYSIAQIVEIVQGSKDRVEPRCVVFGQCGGCHYQHIAYERQLSIKEEILVDCLQRLGKIEIQLEETLKGPPWHYRSKAQFKVSKDGLIGFYRENSRDVVYMERCLILKDSINSILNKLAKRPLPPGIKELHIMGDQTTLVYIKGSKIDNPTMDMFMGIGINGVVLEDGTTMGEKRCIMGMGAGSMRYSVSARGFFQSNWELNLRMVDTVIQALGDIRGASVLDVYGGAGNFAIPLSKAAQSVTVIEENPVCIEDGRENLRLNGIRNVKFVAKAFERLRPIPKADVAIVDPPRRGLSNEAIEKLLAIGPERLVYISCNPSTFARDLAKLKDRYKLLSVRLVDMFPNTYHCEAVGIMSVK